MKKTSFGKLIRSLRTQNRMTQAQLAAKIGVTDKAVSKWERDLSYPDITLFPKLADILGVTVNDLVNDSVWEGRPSRLLQIFEMSPDIRTPLHIILGCVEMAQSHKEDEQQLTHYLENIRISGEYLLGAFDRIMEVTDQERRTMATLRAASKTEAKPLDEYLDKLSDRRGKSIRDYDFTGRRILVAEDIAINREIAGEILGQTGAEVEYARNGKICLEMVEQAPAGYYDLILMDIIMPEMDGIEATRRIRAIPDAGKTSVPIIAASANVSEKDRKASMEAGMNAFAEKPFFIEKLFAAMQACLSSSHRS